FQAEDGIRDGHVTGVQTCALPIYLPFGSRMTTRSEASNTDKSFCSLTSAISSGRKCLMRAAKSSQSFAMWAFFVLPTHTARSFILLQAVLLAFFKESLAAYSQDLRCFDFLAASLAQHFGNVIP